MALRMEKLARAEIQKRLQDLAHSAPPKDLGTGACCYQTAMPAEEARYWCPECGEITLYAAPERGASDLQRRNVGTVDLMIPYACGLLNQLYGVPVELDSAQFCKHCHPEVTEPKLALLIHYEGEPEPRRVLEFDLQDIQLIYEFLSGSAKHDRGMDGEEPLGNHLRRLEILFGVRAPDPARQRET